jgi:hypothetical protein
MLILEVIAALMLPSVLIVGLLWVFPPAKDDRPAAKLNISISTTRILIRQANKGEAVEVKDVPVAVSELGCGDGGGRVSQGLLTNLHGLRRDVYMGRDYKDGYRRSSKAAAEVLRRSGE